MTDVAYIALGSNLGNRELAFLPQLGRPFQTDVTDQFHGRLTCEEQQFLVKRAPAGMELHAQLPD